MNTLLIIIGLLLAVSAPAFLKEASTAATYVKTILRIAGIALIIIGIILGF